MAEQPPLSRIHVVGYSANDRDFPILNLVLDPRVAGYQVPKDLSACPDKRYPSHLFTGAQPIAGDQRVRHVWEILPSPWVPFTRYDDDLGPIQGRRRSVKNEGQVASLTADKRTTYEAREGSAIVYTEIEESWSIKTDEDGNSLFPIRDRDFYDPSRGPVQERRQLFVPTGDEVGSLENVNGVITQTSYEPYNEFLSIKIVQTYSVSGPQLKGNTTSSDGQLATVTTQRKAAKDYVPPATSGRRTVEVSREDEESVIERIVETPFIYTGFSATAQRPDPVPEKFRFFYPTLTQETNSETSGIGPPTLLDHEISKTEQLQNSFIKRTSTTARYSNIIQKSLKQKLTDNDLQFVEVTETHSFQDTTEEPSATKTIQSEELADGNYLIRKTEIPEVFSAKTISKERPDQVPQKFRALVPSTTEQTTIEGEVEEPEFEEDSEISKSEQQINKFVKRISSTKRGTITTPVPLEQKLTTNERQLATVTETLQDGDTTEGPSATKTVESEALGDGNYIVRTTAVPKLFDGKVLSASRPDVIPEQFRASQPAQTTQEVVAQETISMPLLEVDDLEKSEQRISEFTVRKTITSRENGELPTLRGQEYESNINVLIPFEERVTESGAALGSAATFIDPLSKDFDLVREIDLDGVEEELNSVVISFPTRTSLSLPRILKSITVVWDYSVENGNYQSDWHGDSVGDSWALSGAETCSAQASATTSPSFKVDIEEIYATNIPTTSYFFFLKYPITITDILTKLTELVGAPVLDWPIFKPESHVLTASGQSVRSEARANANASGSGSIDADEQQSSTSKTEGKGESRSVGIITSTITIPPTIHGDIIIGEEGTKNPSATATATIGWEGYQSFPSVAIESDATAAAVGRMPSNLAKVSGPTDIPRKDYYLTDSKIEIYQYGFARVYAEVLNASIFA